MPSSTPARADNNHKSQKTSQQKNLEEEETERYSDRE
jgi:hypothetical protein